MDKKKIIILTGATGSGKTALAIDIAKKYNGIIINADSMQIYKDIPIITAQPMPNEQKEIKHYLYNFVELSNNSYSVGKYLQDLKQLLDNIKQEKPEKTPIIVGGTMLYINSIVNGLSKIPEIDKNITDEIRQKYKNKNVVDIFSDLQDIDFEYSKIVDKTNPVRMIRGIEIKTATGKSILDFWKEKNINIFSNDYYFEKYLLEVEREKLYNKINKRFDSMIKNGAIEEAKNIKKKNLTWLPKAIGLNHLLHYLNNDISIDIAIDLSKKDSRHYAKRQITWFKNKFNDFNKIHL